MDIKWKNTRKKGILSLGFVFCLLSGLFLIWGIYFSGYAKYLHVNPSSYPLDEFVFSHPTIQKDIASCTHTLYQMNIDTGFSRDKIEQGDFPRWNRRKEELRYLEGYQAESSPYGYASSHSVSSYPANQESERIQLEKDLYIHAGLAQYDLYLEQLKKACGSSMVLSFVGDGESLPVHTPFDSEKYLFQTGTSYLTSFQTDSSFVYIGVDRTYAQQLFDRFGQFQWIGISSVAGFILAVLSGLAGAVLLIVCGCRKTENGEVCLHWWNYVFPDLTISLAVVAVAVCFQVWGNIAQVQAWEGSSPFSSYLSVFLLPAGAWICLAWSVTSAVKWGQKRQFWRHLLILQPFRLLYFLLRAIKRRIVSICLNQPTAWRLLLLWILSILGTGLVTFGFVLLFMLIVPYHYYNPHQRDGWLWFGGILGFTLCCVFMLHLAARYKRALSTLSSGILKIQEGALEEKIPSTGIHAIDGISESVNHLAEGLRTAVAEEVASQRMKAELITNVSHDLKTPLTSIISYVDLLSKEEMPTETAKSYLAVLQEKSDRLRMLIEDLFEISKAESGNIKANPERLCLQDLLRQLLAEYEERFQAIGLQPRVHCPEEKIFVFADSMILWRVFSNLLGNIAKYSMPNTRVYIDISADEKFASVALKNLANYEMNFKEDEILQRFTRGDAARTGEGSGLGLAIADSFVAASNGSFQVTVDGDLFKATVRLPLAEEAPPAV